MECPAWRAAPDERTVRMAEGAISGKTWCPRGFVTIEEALAQIDLGLDGRLGEDVRAAIRRLSAHREQMPDDLGDLEDAIVRELTRDGHGQLDTVAAAPILADLLEMELGHRGHGSHEVIPEDMSLSDALDYAFDVSLLMGLHRHSRELVAYLALHTLESDYKVAVVSSAMVNLAWNALPQDRSWDDGVSVSQCLSELWERARQTNEELLTRHLDTQLAQVRVSAVAMGITSPDKLVAVPNTVAMTHRCLDSIPGPASLKLAIQASWGDAATPGHGLISVRGLQNLIDLGPHTKELRRNLSAFGASANHLQAAMEDDVFGTGEGWTLRDELCAAAHDTAWAADRRELLAFLRTGQDAIRSAATSPRDRGELSFDARTAVRRLYEDTLREELREHRAQAVELLALDRILAGNGDARQSAMTLEAACELRRGVHRLTKLDKQIPDLITELDELAASLSLVPEVNVASPSLDGECVAASRAAAALERQGQARDAPDRDGRGGDER